MEEVKQPLTSEQDDSGLLTSKERLQKYHGNIGFLMKDLKKIQTNGLSWTLRLGDQRKHIAALKMPSQSSLATVKVTTNCWLVDPRDIP
jgi:hypothetical protein